MRTTLAILLSLITLTSVSQSFGDLCREGIKQITNKNYEKALVIGGDTIVNLTIMAVGIAFVSTIFKFSKVVKNL